MHEIHKMHGIVNRVLMTITSVRLATYLHALGAVYIAMVIVLIRK